MLKWTLMKTILDVTHLESFFSEQNQHLQTVFLKEGHPFVNPTLFSSTPVFFIPFPLHLFISPLFHLSSHFLSSSPVSLPCHSFSLLTRTWWQGLIFYSTGRNVNQQSSAWWEICFCVCAQLFTFNDPQCQ